MKKSLVLVFASFLLTGCMGFLGPSSAPQGCEKIEEQEGRDRCFLQRVVTTEDPADCLKIEGVQVVTDCYIELAVATRRVDHCLQLDGDQRDSCVTFFAQQGYAKGISDCAQHEDVDSCLIHQATVRNNPNYCLKTSDYQACMAALLKSPPDGRLPCDNVDGQERVTCMVGVAQHFEDPSFCKELTKENEVKACESEFQDSDDAEDGMVVAMYANMICQLADPAAWEGMFDEKSDEEIAADEAQTLKLYTDFGYANEAAARVALEAVWGQDSFKDEVKDAVARDCQENINVAGLSLDEFLSQPVAEALGN